MSDAPKRIFLHDAGDYNRAAQFEVTWSVEPEDSEDTAYIRADLVLSDPRVVALVEAVKNTLTGYDQWANCASGTPEDTIATAALFSRINRLRAALPDAAKGGE